MTKLYQIDTWDPEKPFLDPSGICFDPRNGSGATGNSSNINYMGFVAFITPDKFLSLCLPMIDRRTSDSFFESALPEGHCIAPPMLYLAKTLTEDGHWRITGHEGRHRALACKRLGVETIPVSCYPQTYRSRDMKEIIEAGELNQIQNEGKRRFISFDPAFWVIDRKVYAAGSGRWWTKPQEITTTPMRKPIPNWDGEYYFSRRNPLPRRRNFQKYVGDEEYQIKVKVPFLSPFPEENVAYFNLVAESIKEAMSKADVTSIDMLGSDAFISDEEGGGDVEADAYITSTTYDFIIYLNNKPASRRLFSRLKKTFRNSFVGVSYRG